MDSTIFLYEKQSDMTSRGDKKSSTQGLSLSRTCANLCKSL